MAIDKTDILSGPIVRRVAPTEVSIWIALKKAAKIELSVWNGMITTNNDGTIDETPIGSNEQDAVQIGKDLHMAVVRLALSSDKQLQWSQLYSYNLKFTTTDNDVKDFKSLSLLDVIGQASIGHTTLSYQANQLPSFALPAENLENLKILHGSCRNNANQFEDALSFVDDLIKEKLADPLERPQQLFLSGDQVYADSVVGPLLHHLTEFGNNLLDKKETLPTTWADPDSGKKRWPADRIHFPAFIRRRLIDSEARFTTTDTANHLISFGEFVGMYLSVWSDVPWPDLDNDIESFEEIFNSITAVSENYGALFRRNLFEERTGEKELFGDAVMKRTLEFLLVTTNKEILRTMLTNSGSEEQKNTAKNELKNFLDGTPSVDKRQTEEFFSYLREWIGPFYPEKPGEDEKVTDKDKDRLKVLHQTLPKVRRALANISTFMIFDDHEITDDWNLNPSWRDRVFTSPLGKTIIRNGMMAYALFQDWGNQANRYNRKGHFFELDTNLVDELNTQSFTETLQTAFAENGISVDAEKVTIKVLHTDEWLLENLENKDDFLIRKYKMKANEDEVLKVLGNSHAHLLGKISELFSKDNDADVIADIEEEIDFLLGLDVQHRVIGSAGGRQQLPDNRSPLIKWHYTFDGAKHKVLVIDNRTRRSYVDFDGAPGNLSVNGMKDLIPEKPEPKADEVVFVVAPLPVLGPSVLDELLAPLLYKIFDLKDSGSVNAIKAGMQGTNPDAIEAWTFDPESQEELLKRLAPFKRIIFLSGDVHYASSQRLCYWTKDNAKATACFAQLTSSGLRNIMPGIIQKASQHFLNLQKLVRQNLRAERLGWFDHKKSPDPVKLPDKARISFLNGKLKKSPVIIPVLGWPAGTETGRDPDWSWRIENVLDQRQESERPSSTRIAPLKESDDMMDNLRKVAGRHIAQAKQVNHTRQLLFKSNLGMVTFEMKVLVKKEEEEEKKQLLVHHDLYAVAKVGKPGNLQKQEVYTKHTIVLEASEDEKAPTFPKIKAETDG